jgi:uncharacterized protein YkwD
VVAQRKGKVILPFVSIHYTIFNFSSIQLTEGNIVLTSALRSIGLLACALIAPLAMHPRPVNAAASFDPATVCPYTSAPSYASSATSDPAAMEAELVQLINSERARYGLWPVTSNALLNTVARNHSADMAARNFFDHTNPEGKTPAMRAEEAGYPAYGWGDVFAGEDIAAGYTTPGTTLAGWMTSAGHCVGVLNPEFREIGTGYAHADSSQYRHYWTALFASAPLVLPVSINGGATTTTDRTVTLTLTDETVSSYGSLEPVTEVMVSEAPNFAGATWQSFPQGTPPTMPYQLSEGNGVKTIYVRYRDARGSSTNASASITLNASQAAQQSALTVVQTSNQLHQVALRFEGSGNWTASEDADWLSLSPNSGSGPTIIAVAVDTARLPTGEHSATIVLRDTSIGTASARPLLNIPVRLIVGQSISSVKLPLVTAPLPRA